jgi:hypothetical protein
MARVDKEAFHKRMESDMRQFGDEMSNWADTHSDVSDQVRETLKDRWKSLDDRFRSAGSIGDDRWEEFASGLDKDLSDLKGEYRRYSGRHSER